MRNVFSLLFMKSNQDYIKICEALGKKGANKANKDHWRTSRHRHRAGILLRIPQVRTLILDQYITQSLTLSVSSQVICFLFPATISTQTINAPASLPKRKEKHIYFHLSFQQ